MIINCYLTGVFSFLTFCSSVIYAQSDEQAVKKVINNLFEGMKKADTALIRSAFGQQSIMQTVVFTKEGKTKIIDEPIDSFLYAIGQPHNEVYDERISFDVIKIDGELAIVWAPYKFYLGEKFSHCGVDSFQLAKINGEWKIIYLADTRRRQGCK
jgi:hypothetical protein